MRPPAALIRDAAGGAVDGDRQERLVPVRAAAQVPDEVGVHVGELELLRIGGQVGVGVGGQRRPVVGDGPFEELHLPDRTGAGRRGEDASPAGDAGVAVGGVAQQELRAGDFDDPGEGAGVRVVEVSDPVHLVDGDRRRAPRQQTRGALDVRGCGEGAGLDGSGDGRVAPQPACQVGGAGGEPRVARAPLNGGGGEQHEHSGDPEREPAAGSGERTGEHRHDQQQTGGGEQPDLGKAQSHDDPGPGPAGERGGDVVVGDHGRRHGKPPGGQAAGRADKAGVNGCGAMCWVR